MELGTCGQAECLAERAVPDHVRFGAVEPPTHLFASGAVLPSDRREGGHGS